MPKILIVAGESSGDALGGPLMAELKALNPDISFIGVGGPLMQAEGLEEVFPLEDLNVMGFVEVLPRIPLIMKRLRQLTALVERGGIDAVVTIDAQDFSKRLAARVKQVNPQVPCIHYVCPTVWAWRPKRAEEYAKIFDHVLALFPFEPPYFTKHGLACTFVGHPVAERLGAYSDPVPVVSPSPRLALLPGSRQGEVKRHWPVMRETFLALKGRIPDLTGVVVLPKETGIIRDLITDIPEGVEVVTGEERFQALQGCRAALAKSGTGNLELAVLGVPMVVGYKMSSLTFAVAKRLVKVPYVSIVNWVAQKQVVPEFVQHHMNTVELSESLYDLLINNTAWKEQVDALQKVRQRLPKQGAAARAAQVVAKYIR